jgi:hypothetical protein
MQKKPYTLRHSNHSKNSTSKGNSMTLKHQLISLAPLVLVGVVACSNNDDTVSNNSTTPPVDNQSTTINDDLIRITANAAAVTAASTMEVTLDDDDVSVMVQLVTTDPGKIAFITEIRDPDDVVIYSGSLDPDTGEPGPVVSEYFDSILGDIGAANVFLPPTPELVLIPGTYRISFLTEDDVALSRAEAFVKSAPASGTVDQESYQVDLNIWIAHPEAAFNDEAFEQTIQTTFKDSINTIMAPHSLQIATVNVLKASAAEVTQFGDISAEDDEQAAAACRAMQAATTNKLALNLVYVRALTSSEGGGPAGFSSSPGVILDDQAGTACFFVGQTAYVAEPDSGFTQDLADQMMAGNILHEAGHFMSLQHPTEEAGDDFDQIMDTPQCDAATYDGRDDAMFGVPGEMDGVITDFECGIDGGAKNFLFYSGVPHFLPFEMSADQAKVLRRHPLFVKAP